MALGPVARALMVQVETRRARIKYLGRGFLAFGFHDRHPGRAGFLRCWRSGSPPVPTDRL